MTRKIGIAAFLLCCVALSGAALAVGLPRPIGIGHDAEWSPGEDYVSYVRNDTLFASPLDERKMTITIMTGPIIKYEWLDSDQLAVQTRQYYPHPVEDIRVEHIYRCRIDSEPELVARDSVGGDSRAASDRLRLTRFADGTIGYFTNASGAERIEILSRKSADSTIAASPNLYVRCDPQPRGPVWLYYGSSGDRKIVLSETGKFILPQLAPTSDKFFCKNNAGDLVVFDTSGVFISNLGRASMPRWDNTGQWIAYCVAEWGHYDLLASDIAVVRFDGKDRTRLTESPELEEEPQFSPSGDRLLFREEKSGQIFLVELE